jgi:DNA-binding transcriptional MerR regulator
MDDSTTTESEWTVAKLAALTGVSVRTLHHYDQLGLLEPSSRTDAGYRLYGPAQLERLRAILVWRRLGVQLSQIGALLDSDDSDRVDVLVSQRARVSEQMQQLAVVASALDAAIESGRMATTESAQTREGANMGHDRTIIEALDGFDPSEHDAETQARWGDTRDYRESARRTSIYTPDQWVAIKHEADAITVELAACWHANEAADSVRPLALAERFRAHVDRWYYPCRIDRLQTLGDMYVLDPRFRATYDEHAAGGAGFAEYVRDVWHAAALAASR